MNSKDIADKNKAIIARIRRAKGQLGAVERLVESDADCTKIAQQMRAVRSALDSAYFEMMSCAIEEALHESIESDGHWPSVVQEMTKTMAKYA